MGFILVAFTVPQASGQGAGGIPQMLQQIIDSIGDVKQDTSSIKSTIDDIQSSIDANLDTNVGSRASQESVDNLHLDVNGIGQDVNEISTKIDGIIIPSDIASNVALADAISQINANTDSAVGTKASQESVDGLHGKADDILTAVNSIPSSIPTDIATTADIEAIQNSVGKTRSLLINYGPATEDGIDAPNGQSVPLTCCQQFQA